MAFSIVAAGVRDIVPLDNLFVNRVVEQAEPIVRTDRVELEKNEAEKRTSQAQQRFQRAYENVARENAAEGKVTRAEQIMSSPVVTLSPQRTLAEAWVFFRNHRFRHVPITDESNRLVGLISDRDMLRISLETQGEHSAQENILVADFMRDRVLAATPDTLIRDVARVFFLQRIGAMPVIHDDALVGMITRSDILRTIVNEAPLELWV